MGCVNTKSELVRVIWFIRVECMGGISPAIGETAMFTHEQLYSLEKELFWNGLVLKKNDNNKLVSDFEIIKWDGCGAKDFIHRDHTATIIGVWNEVTSKYSPTVFRGPIRCRRVRLIYNNLLFME